MLQDSILRDDKRNAHRKFYQGGMVTFLVFLLLCSMNTANFPWEIIGNNIFCADNANL